ncbi:MAG TPA: glutamate--tRNA ligase family protein [Rhizomicrobium sp.]
MTTVRIPPSPTGYLQVGNGRMAILNALFALALLTANPATAGPDCTMMVSQSAFEEGGTKLVALTRWNLEDLPRPRFYCGRLACNGAIDFSGYIDERGAVHILKTDGNSWKTDRAWHARVLKSRLERAIYAPPTLNGRPVCVKMRWDIMFARPETDWRP